VQAEPSGEGATQVPAPAFVITGKDVQLETAHDPTVDQTEAEQVAVTVPKYPVLHVKEQELPETAFEVQVPEPAFATKGNPVQLLVAQEPVVIQLLWVH